MTERAFPVLKWSTRAEMPRMVSWEFAERFRAQAESNHGQTLERLAERGGLCPREMWLATHGETLRSWRKISESDAIAWLNAELAGRAAP